MKYFEIGFVILIFASVLRTCSYDNDVSDKQYSKSPINSIYNTERQNIK